MWKPHQKVCIYGIGYLEKLVRAKISGKNLCGFPPKLCCFITFFRPCHRSFTEKDKIKKAPTLCDTEIKSTDAM